MAKRPNRPTRRYGYAGQQGVRRMQKQLEQRDAEYAGRQPNELGSQYMSDGTPYQTAKEARQLLDAQQKILRRRAEPNKEVSSMVKAGVPHYSNRDLPPATTPVKRPVNKSTLKEGRKRRPPTRIAKTASRARYGY